MDRALSDAPVGGPAARRRAALVGLRCRTSDRTRATVRGVQALAAELSARMELEARLIGSLPDEVAPAAWDEDLRASRGCLLEAGGQVDDALAGGLLPVLLAGQCSIALTTLPALRRHRPDARVLWLDAHGDFHTPQTTASGVLAGMALAGACGMWEHGLADESFPAEQVVLCGVRALDGGERGLLERSAATVIGGPLESFVVARDALARAPVFVHVDVDVLDPEHMPASAPAAGGLSPERLYALCEAVAESSEIVGLEIAGFEAPEDRGDRTELAAVIADAIAPLLPPSV